MTDPAARTERLVSEFRRRFGGSPQVCVRAPGRVPLMGSHTDYNDGFVVPAAIDRDVRIAASPRADATVRLYSLNFDQSDEFRLSDFAKADAAPWSNYVRGVARILQSEGLALPGLDAALEGNVPLGAGLSSSAAIEVATAVLFQALSDWQLEGPVLARLCQRAENEFVGMNCGIMDQFISLLGKADHVLCLDCRDLSYEVVPFEADDVRLVVADTRKPRELVDSQYNVRRATCERGAATLATKIPGVRALRDVTSAQLAEFADLLAPADLPVCRHVVAENERVLASIDALKQGDLRRFAAFMDAAQDSFATDFDGSCPELDAMVAVARSLPGVWSAMTAGAGWGGCIVCIVEADAVDHFVAEVGKRYTPRTGLTPEVYVCQTAAGAGQLA